MFRLPCRIVVCFALGTALGAYAQVPSSPRIVTIIPTGDARHLLEFTTGWMTTPRAREGILLIDSPTAGAANQRFNESFRPTSLQIVRRFEQFSSAGNRVVICRQDDRKLRLTAAALAVALPARLCLVTSAEDAKGVLNNGLKECWVAGDLDVAPPDGCRLHRLADADCTIAATIDCQSQRGPIDTLILVNPADGGLSSLAPLAMRDRRAVVLLTNDKGADAGAVVQRALRHPLLRTVEHLLILASPTSIPPERRENPLAGKDAEIEMEPGTPTGSEPYTLSIGRLFHNDPAFVALTLARARLLPPDGAARTALVASNPGGSLPMLETFSRTSARELAACGYETTKLIGEDLSPGQLRRRLPAADLFLWEGHHNTLIKDWGFSNWSEPLPPSFFFLQSCLALTEEKVSPLIERGALAVAGSSSRIYSATGGAFSLASLDAMLYDRQSLGGSIRSAKNFLLAYGQLKEKRLEQVKLVGANQRSAWAFTLWGDPALRLPSPPSTSTEAVRCRTQGDVITITAPPSTEKLESGSFRSAYRPNARLAGLVRTGDDGEKRLVPFAFAEVPLPHALPGYQPRLRTKQPDANWVFLWDARRRVGWLLAVLPSNAERELRFHIEWSAHDE